CTVEQGKQIGVCGPSTLLQVYRCTVTGNGIGFLAGGDADGSFIRDCAISGNGFGVSNSAPVLDARWNWWGDASGPHDPSDDRSTGGWYNPNGKGDGVSDLVQYPPWLNSFSPPAAPVGLTAVATGPTAVRLDWTDNSTNGGGFEIERKVGGGDYTLLATVAGGVTTYRDTGLAPQTLYTYQVRAVNAAGESGFSNEAPVITPPAGTTYAISGTVTLGGAGAS